MPRSAADHVVDRVGRRSAVSARPRPKCRSAVAAPLPAPRAAAAAAAAAAAPAALRLGLAGGAVRLGRRRAVRSVGAWRARPGVADRGRASPMLGLSAPADGESPICGRAVWVRPGLLERDVGDVVGGEAAVGGRRRCSRGRRSAVVGSSMSSIVVGSSASPSASSAAGQVGVDGRCRPPASAASSPLGSVPSSAAAPFGVADAGFLRRLRPPRRSRRRRRGRSGCRRALPHRRRAHPHRMPGPCAVPVSAGLGAARPSTGVLGACGRVGGGDRLRDRLVGHRFLLS